MGNASRCGRILFITHNYPRHGEDFAGRFLARLAGQLISEGDQVTVLAPHHPGAALKETVERVRVVRFRYGPDHRETLAYRGDLGKVSLIGPRGILAHQRFFSSFRRAALELVRSDPPDVIHAHWWVPGGWIARGLPFSGRVIVTLHGTDLRMLQQKSYLRPLAARVFQRAEVVTVVSTWLAETLARLVPSVAGKLHVTPMPPDDAVFVPSVEPRRDDPVPTVLCVTRFTGQKRNSVLLDALSLLRQQKIEFKARFIGDGPLRRDCEERARSLELTNVVVFDDPRPQSELAEAYRESTVTVLPAVDEGFGMTLLEAQLCGTAVIGARSGGLTDIIEHEKTGLLAGPDDPQSLADVLGRVLSDQALRLRLAQEGQRSARDRFSSRAIVARFREWYFGSPVG